MSTLKWVRGVNGTLGWFAPKLVASKMRLAFMTPRFCRRVTGNCRYWPSSERITLRFGLVGVALGAGTGRFADARLGRPADSVCRTHHALVEAGYTVVALDGPAHGRSPGT
jgi:hypothetical protein